MTKEQLTSELCWVVPPRTFVPKRTRNETKWKIRNAKANQHTWNGRRSLAQSFSSSMRLCLYGRSLEIQRDNQLTEFKIVQFQSSKSVVRSSSSSSNSKASHQIVVTVESCTNQIEKKVNQIRYVIIQEGTTQSTRLTSYAGVSSLSRARSLTSFRESWTLKSVCSN